MQFLQSNPLYLIDDEVSQLDDLIKDTEVAGVSYFYDTNLYYISSYGPIPSTKINFSNLSRGLRRGFYSVYDQYSGYIQNKDLEKIWNYALS